MVKNNTLRLQKMIYPLWKKGGEKTISLSNSSKERSKNPHFPQDAITVSTAEF